MAQVGERGREAFFAGARSPRTSLLIRRADFVLKKIDVFVYTFQIIPRKLALRDTVILKSAAVGMNAKILSPENWPHAT